MIPCELYITPITFNTTTVITYEIELPPSGKKVGLNLLDDEESKKTYITDTISNSQAFHQLPTQAKQRVWLVSINVDEPITAQCSLDELKPHQNPCGKSKVKINLCRRKS